MIKLKHLLSESTHISIKDIDDELGKIRNYADHGPLLRTIESFYYDDDPEKRKMANDYISLLNSVFEYVVKISAPLNIPHIDASFIRHYLLRQTEFKSTIEEFFPFPLYVSVNKNSEGDWADVGIMIDKNGKVLEIHEGNDEATTETNAFVNSLVNPHGNKVRIYSAQPTPIVYKIDETGYLPPNIYVSKLRSHANSYLDLEGLRSLFTGIIDSNLVAQESELDWRTLGQVKIEKFRWI